jgi:hypothetical protein
MNKQQEDCMKSRWSSVVFMAGLVLALSGLAGTAVGPRAAQATTSCPISGDFYGCLATGSTAARALEVRNSKSGNQVFGILGVVQDTSGVNYGVDGASDSTNGYGVFGYATASSGPTVGTEGYAASTSGTGVRGDAIATSGTNYGVYGTSASPDGYGVYGKNTASTGPAYGVYGESTSTAVKAYGVYGKSPVYGVYGESTGGYGMYGKSPIHGVWGQTTGNGAGVVGSGGLSGIGVNGVTLGTYAMYASNQKASGVAYGLESQVSSPDGIGVHGYASATSGTNYGIYGYTASSSGYAGYFDGRVHINGTLSKSAGSFKIDHPLDPANKYLSHSFVESPDMMNIYNGNVTLDAKGRAVVEMPKWFEALNQEFRYQLTAIGAPGPNLYIAEEIKGNRFTIAGGAPGSKVSWQVTGIRHDPYANANRIQVEENKPAAERGTYLYPQGYGQSETKGRDYQQRQQVHAAP